MSTDLNMGLQPYQQRVMTEKAELDAKAFALSMFIGHNPLFETLDAAEQERLKEQNDVMWKYSEILGERLAGFKVRVEPGRTKSKDVMADFEIHAGGEYFASVSGQREQAWKEVMHYVSTLSPEDGEPEVFEVTRHKVFLTAQPGGSDNDR